MDKRKERRIRVSLPINIAYGRGKQFSSVTDNISRLGAYVQSAHELAIGTEIEVILQMPGKTRVPAQVKCKGRIFRCEPIPGAASQASYGLGIFFTEFLTPADKDKLSNYVDSLILKEEHEIASGIKRWAKKRQAHEKKTVAQLKGPLSENYPGQAEGLLRKILSRLDEISRLLRKQIENP